MLKSRRTDQLNRFNRRAKPCNEIFKRLDVNVRAWLCFDRESASATVFRFDVEYCLISLLRRLMPVGLDWPVSHAYKPRQKHTREKTNPK